jgi:hypothetical protein
MSRNAVSCEHFASFPYFMVVSFPSKPSSNRLTTSRCRSFSKESPKVSPKSARTLFGSCKRHIGDSSRDPTVAVFEGVDGVDP